MRDPCGREIDTLRISVTDRCNLRCWYCMPQQHPELLRPEELLTFDEIESVVRAAVDLGFRCFRLTGGEPLLRPNLVELVGRLAAIPGVHDLAMTTNGILLARQAAQLRTAGLRRINVSLDSIDPARYAEVTHGGELAAALAGIEAARAAGLSPIKLNCVVESNAEEPDARAVAAFAAQHGYAARFIPRMEMERGLFSQVIGGRGGDCPSCNRLRLSSHGLLLPCLFSEPVFSVRKLGAEEALRRAVEGKPEQGGRCSRNWMHGIGG